LTLHISLADVSLPAGERWC